MGQRRFRFVDLFCGIGGFHQALTKFGGECVFAAEIDKDCIEVYAANYGINASHDMTKIAAESVPEHEVLCAGFPCQAFSKAGKQAGVNDTRGTLFFEIERLLRHHHPQFILLENVRNLVAHDDGRTWQIITSVLKDIGYRLTAEPLILSPHQFGIPQLRERVYIAGVYDPENVDQPLVLEFNGLKDKNQLSIYDILDNEDITPDFLISAEENRVLEAWDEFYKGIDLKVIGFPVNIEYFNYKGNISSLPEWKQSHIVRNQRLYARNKTFIDSWLKRWNNLDDFIPTHRKFEWQCGSTVDSIFDALIQMRPSGVRVKAPTAFPALVAMVQIPIIGKYRRRLTPRECARLQSFPDSFKICGNKHQALKQFGNSVNVNVLEAVFGQLIHKYGPIKTMKDNTKKRNIYIHATEGVQNYLFDPQALYVSKKDGKLILMGSCRRGNREWIKKKLLYNYPVTELELEDNPQLKDVEFVYILHRRRLVGAYKVKNFRVVSRFELEVLGYPIASSRRRKTDKYILYTLEEIQPSIASIDLTEYQLMIGKGIKAQHI